MVGLDYVINMVDNSFLSGMKQNKRATEGLDTAVNGVDKKTRGLKNASKQGFGSMITMAKKAAIATGLVFGIGQATAFANEITNVTSKFEGYENAIEFASGKEGANNIQFLDKTIKDLNLNIGSSYTGFKTLTGSLKGTKLEGQATRDIFESVGIASTVMGLTAEQSEGAFLALSQMASKGKVQAEELRGQLGERIPGAFGIAAKAMGVTQVEMNKMLDTGKVYAEDFLPKFAKELKKTFQDGLPAAANSMQAAINKKNNSLVGFKKSFGENFRPAIIEVINLKAQFFGFLSDLAPKLKPIFSAIGNLANAVKPLTDRFITAKNAIGGMDGVLNLIKKGIDGFAVVLEIAANGLSFLSYVLEPFAPLIAAVTVGWWALNIAMTANPVGLVVAGIAALAGGLMYAYKKVDWFRGGIMAAWEGLKGFGNIIKNYVINRIKDTISGLTGLASAVWKFIKGDWQGAMTAGKKSVKDLLGVDTKQQALNDFKKLGKDVGNVYAKGVAEAKENSKESVSIFDAIKGNKTAQVPGKKTNTANGSLNGNTVKSSTLNGSVAGGSSVKNVTFKIESLVKQISIQPQTLTEGVQDVEKQVKDLFIRMIRDVELQTN